MRAFPIVVALAFLAACSALGDVIPATNAEVASLGQRLEQTGQELAELGQAVEHDANAGVTIEDVLLAAGGSTAVGGFLLNLIRSKSRAVELRDLERRTTAPTTQSALLS